MRAGEKAPCWRARSFSCPAFADFPPINPRSAYRLLADNTVEQKIRALQKEKATLAAAVVQEESLASVMDLDSLRRILG